MGKVVDCNFEISGSTPPHLKLFFAFFLVFFRKCGRPAFAEDGGFFAQKYLRILLKIYYINYRYDRHYAEDLRPPHFWQTNSNYGSLRRVIPPPCDSINKVAFLLSSLLCCSCLAGEEERGDNVAGYQRGRFIMSDKNFLLLPPRDLTSFPSY